MPFKIDYNAEHNALFVIGSIAYAEIGDFETQYVAAKNKMLNEGRPQQQPQRQTRGNWHDLFCNLLAYSEHYAPPDNTLNLNDPYGFKQTTVRMWRAISGASFVDAKQFVDNLIKQGDRPSGLEHGDVTQEVIEETTRYFTEAKRKTPR